jgi:hypothetical protein
VNASPTIAETAPTKNPPSGKRPLRNAARALLIGASGLACSLLGASGVATTASIAGGVAFLATEPTAIAQGPIVVPTRLRVVGPQPMGFRGDRVTWTVQLTDAFGNRMANTPIMFQYRSAIRQEDGTVNLGMVLTNARGEATLRFTIPTNPHEDNVYLEAYAFPPAPIFTYSYAEQRVAIGRRR